MKLNRNSAQRLTRGPQFLVRDVHHAIDHGGIVVRVEPVRAEVTLEQRSDLGRHPRRHVHAVGDRPHRQLLTGDTRPDRLPHLLGDLAVQLADAVDGAAGPHRERRHVEHRAAAVVVMTEREKLLAVSAEVAPRAGQVRFDQVKRKRIVPGRDRRVRREHRGAANFVERLLEARAGLAQIADPLQDDERGVPFVEVIDRGRVAHRLQHADAADAEDDFLLHARLAIAAVETRRQLAIPRRVLLEIGVEQVQHDASDADAPDRDEHRSIAERHRRDARLAVRRDRRLDRRAASNSASRRPPAAIRRPSGSDGNSPADT